MKNAEEKSMKCCDQMENDPWTRVEKLPGLLRARSRMLKAISSVEEAGNPRNNLHVLKTTLKDFENEITEILKEEDPLKVQEGIDMLCDEAIFVSTTYAKVLRDEPYDMLDILEAATQCPWESIKQARNYDKNLNDLYQSFWENTESQETLATENPWENIEPHERGLTSRSDVAKEDLWKQTNRLPGLLTRYSEIVSAIFNVQENGNPRGNLDTLEKIRHEIEDEIRMILKEADPYEVECEIRHLSEEHTRELCDISQAQIRKESLKHAKEYFKLDPIENYTKYWDEFIMQPKDHETEEEEFDEEETEDEGREEVTVFDSDGNAVVTYYKNGIGDREITAFNGDNYAVVTFYKDYKDSKDSKDCVEKEDKRTFESGAVRDISKGKGRCDLLPAEALLRLSKLYERGATTYPERNWEKGIPISVFMDSGMRHLLKYMDGQDDEDHLIAAAWNILGAAWTEEKRPNLVDLPSRVNRRNYGVDKE